MTGRALNREMSNHEPLTIMLVFRHGTSTIFPLKLPALFSVFSSCNR
jgi:hypothetical protein